MKLALWGLQAAVIWSSLLPAVYAAREGGLRLKVNGKRNPPDLKYSKRGNILGSSTLSNSADISYYANVTLGGVSFSVLIDTGSSDLWVAGSVPNAKETGKNSGVTYAIGAIQGPVQLADLNFTGYVVSDQAFIQVTPDSTNPQGLGLIGLGPNQGSNVFSTLGSVSGAAVVDRIFRQNTSTPNFLSVLLGRYDDPTDTFPGDITVGDILQGYENITSQSKLDVTQVSTFESGSQHWQTLIDANGVLGPDGQPITLTTVVAKTSDAYKLTAVFDTGFSLPQVPEALATAVYGRIPGAQFANRSDVGGIWQVPCDKEVNMTFIFAGQKIPIHPLDTTIDLNVTDDSGNKVCLGAFQPITTAQDSNYDVILGMAFLRNVYILIDYGDFVDGTSVTANPYIQLLATTDPTEAHQDFVNVRLGGKDDQSWQLLPASSTGSTPKAASQFVRKIEYYWPIIAGVAGFLVLVLIISCLCVRRRKRTNSRPFWRSQKSYRPLQDPAPVGMHALGGPRPSSSDYRNPWDSRY
ncbi:acid protease [Thelephora terrestris]|uniref:Acid protease n=1 Tax=Thelephora terrestris TaxID=56493 RepID=A0A9P6L5A5_9AGAM|nr:acid protease [Thelephora terrestris]